MADQKEKGMDKLGFIESLKKRWIATIDAISDPLLIVDNNYTIEKTNKALADLSQKDIKDILGQKCYKVFAQKDAPCPGCKMRQAADTGKTAHFELENISNKSLHEVTAEPILTADNKVEGVVTIYRDRTQARSIQTKLMQNEKLASIGLLAGGIAHEINNPLGGILIFSQMLLREMDKKSSHYADVVEIEAAAQRCKEIVESLLDFARMQPSEKKVLDKVDMKSVMSSALKFAQVGSHRHDIEVIESICKEDLYCMGNHNKMIQLFLNLIQNAFGAMKKGGTLTITAKVRSKNGKKWASFEIKDTGSGIKKSALDKIFDPFFTTKPEGQGTGLGLSICHGIVKEYNGTIEIKSKEGIGTTFCIGFLALEIKDKLTA